MSISLLRQLLMKEAVKKSAGSSGIMTINKNIAADVDKLLQKYINDALAQGVDIETLSPDQLKMIVAMNQPKPPKVFSGQEAMDQLNKLFPKKGEVVKFPQKRSFKEEIEAMRKSGDIVDADNIKISEKITDREMFKDANKRFKGPIKGKQDMGPFGKVDVETDYSSSINRPEFFDPKAKNMYGETVKTGAEFIGKEKERILNLINNKKKNMVPPTHSNYKLLKKSLQDQEDALEAIKITEDLGGNENMFDFLRTQNIADYKAKPLQRSNYTKTDAEIKAEIEAGNKKGIESLKNKKDDPEGFYTGGMVDVEPNLSDIGHGSDALMARTRLVAPDSQATTSTGLNYLLAEDNDNIRVPFGSGKRAYDHNSFDHKINSLNAHYKRYKKMGGTIPFEIFSKAFAEQNFAEGGRIGFAGGESARYENYYIDPKTGELKKKPKLKQKAEPFYPKDFNIKDYYDPKPFYPKDSPLSEVNFAEGGRIGFKVGGDAGRRAFLKLLATLTGGVAAAKSGILGLGGKEAGKKAVTETIKKSAGSGQPPPYFFELMETISKNGKEIKSYGERVKQTVAPSKDGKSELLMTEDLNTGSVQIKKIHKEGDDMVTKSEEMNYTKNMGDESTKGKPADEYEEITEYNSRIYKDEFNDPDVVEGVDVESIVKEVDVNPQDVGKVKYEPRANGGRIDFMGGGLANVLARLGIKGSSGRFLEKVFGKEGFKEMTKNDPDMYRGLLEVVEMFRNRDKEGLKSYMKNFMPHMDDAEIEQFIIGSTPDIEGLSGQLTRLGSGRDYSQKLQMIKNADEVKKLEKFDIKNVTKNAEGGRIGFSGGGIFRAIIAKAAAAKGMKPYEFIKVTSYKSLPPEVKMFLSAEDFARLKSGQKDMYSNYIDMAKTRKNFQEQVEGGKTTPAKPLFENMEKIMDEQSYVPKTVTADDIAEMELMVKNRFNKGRKDNALGGLQTMLGE